jgi:hypothetical protein
MAIEIDTPVSAIEGIGPTTAAAFGQAGIYTACDLLRVTVSALHAAVDSLASENEARSWQRMAALMQVREVTSQWAEALVRGGIEAIDELQGKRLDELDALFRDAVERGIAPSAPELPQITEMLKDAAVLRFTGALVGKVVGPGGQPAASATLRIAGREYLTDQRGRFRILRIPLGRTWPLRIEHADFATLTVAAPSIAADASVLGGLLFTLAEPGTEPAIPMTLSELDGDELPASWDRVRQVALDPPQLREGDLLLLREFYQSAPDASLVSLLRTWKDGELLVHTLRVPRSMLPSGAKLNDQFRVVGGAVKAVSMTPLDVHRSRIDRRLRKAFANHAQPTTPEGWAALLKEQLEFRAAQGYYAFRGRAS